MKRRFSIRLSPLAQKRLQNFLRIRRARWALVLLTALFSASLVSELLCNSRPLFLRVNGNRFFPFLQNLTQRDLLGPGADGTRVNYHAFTVSDAFKADPLNRVLWAPVPFSPGDVIDASTLRDFRTVKVSIVPETHAGRINLLPDHTVVMPLSCNAFFPGTPRIDGQLLNAHWRLTPDLLTALAERFAGRASPSRSFVLEHATQPGLSAIAVLPETHARPAPPPSVRLTFRQTTPPELPFQVRFRRTAEGRVYPVSPSDWAKVPSPQQAEVLALATEGFAGTAPKATIAWKDRHADIACAVIEIAWPFPPVKGHWLGIDSAGRDVLARVLYGMRTAMIFGLLLALWAMAFGLIIGSVQGYFGGWIDIAGQRITEIWSALPFLYVMIFVGAALGRSFLLLLLCYSLFNWIGISYYMRAEFLRLRSRTFVEAARCQGLSAPRIIFSHILPNALTPLITLFPFSLIGAIGSLAALDFLGFGLPPLTPSWGELLQQAQMFRWAWWLILFPSLALFLVMFLTVLVGEGLRDAFDPRQQTKME
jgi:microcin C transport system permease protein